MIISWETAENALNIIAENFYSYLSKHVIELDLNDEHAVEWLVDRTNEFTRLVFPLFCEAIGIDGVEEEE